MDCLEAMGTMRTLSVGITNRREAGVTLAGEAGVTLVEMLIVVAIIALLSAISYPSAAAGIDSLRLRSASNEIVNFLNTALEHASRQQQAVELRISPTENAMAARSADSTFVRAAAISDPVRILSVQPIPENGAGPAQTRRFLLYPGGSIPRIGIEIGTRDGRRRMVSVDPITGIPQSVVEAR
jgi:prepilin-type N-terminal cleavage/methylation domain-containing protein